VNVQSLSSVVLIRPHHFCPNPAAFRDSTRLAETLEAAGIHVLMFEDTEIARSCSRPTEADGLGSVPVS